MYTIGPCCEETWYGEIYYYVLAQSCAVPFKGRFTRSMWRLSDLGRPAYLLHMLIN